jgi:4-carboxymuconolactone decarboxylase
MVADHRRGYPKIARGGGEAAAVDDADKHRDVSSRSNCELLLRYISKNEVFIALAGRLKWGCAIGIARTGWEKTMLSSLEARARGTKLLEQLHGAGAAQALIDDMDGLCPDFVDITIEWALGGIQSRPGLDLATRELVVIASCVTLGHAVTQLRAHAQAALAAGATREQIVEAILQLTFYAGGAAVRNALAALRDLLATDASGARGDQLTSPSR